MLNNNISSLVSINSLKYQCISSITIEQNCFYIDYLEILLILPTLRKDVLFHYFKIFEILQLNYILYDI